MPKTLLAVDDSMTMRKVIEMTFAGEDLRVVTATSASEGLAACRRDRPDVVLADLSLEGQNGYDLCRAIKDELKGVPVLLLSSKQNPYDPARGQASGADGNIDKPYDTAKMIELVKKTLEQGRSVAPAPIAATTTASAPAAPRAPMFAQQPPQPAPMPAPPAPAANPPMMRAPTSPGMAQASPSASPDRASAPGRPAPMAAPPVQSRPQAVAPVAAPVAAEVQHGSLAELAQMPGGNGAGGELAGKLQQLGLSSAQVDAVLALSREVVERVVWEVVPVLAETLVKEEIARLTRD